MAMPPYGDYQPHQPTMPGGFQPPPRRRLPIIIAFTIAGLALLVAIVAVVVAVMKSDKNDQQTASGPSTSASAVEQPTQAETQTQTTVVQQPTNVDVRGSLANQGYAYACDSQVLRTSAQTQCGWAQNVRQAALSRGSFTGVPIYSPYLGHSVYTTCSDHGAYYICQGQTSNTIAVIK